MSQSVKFKIELESNGAQILQTLSVDADDLTKAIVGAASEVKTLWWNSWWARRKGARFLCHKRCC